MVDLASCVESTLLTADTTSVGIEALAREAAALGCAGVCVHPVHVRRAVRALDGAPVRVVSVAGFPLGASPASAKMAECRFALDQGAHELDIVIPIWAAVDGDLDALEEEIAVVMEATRGATRKLIVEAALLPEKTLRAVASILNRLRPEYVKTGTGYCRPVATDDVRALRSLLDPAIAIKAAGGIRTRAQAESLVLAGARRIGTSRAAAIVGERA